jgi:hypothetical protein
LFRHQIFRISPPPLHFDFFVLLSGLAIWTVDLALERFLHLLDVSLLLGKFALLRQQSLLDTFGCINVRSHSSLQCFSLQIWNAIKESVVIVKHSFFTLLLLRLRVPVSSFEDRMPCVECGQAFQHPLSISDFAGLDIHANIKVLLRRLFAKHLCKN